MHRARRRPGLPTLPVLLALTFACSEQASESPGDETRDGGVGETTDGGSGEPSDGGSDPADYPDPDEPYTITGTSYYVDPVNGDDARDGLTRETAWRTLDKALTTLAEGDAALLLSGNHGALRETVPRGRTGYVTIKAAEGESPVLTSISVEYDAKADAYLRFDGLRVEPEWVDPGADPQLPGADSNTYQKAATPVQMENVAHLRLFRSSLTGTNKYLVVQAIGVIDSEDVLISGVHARRTGRGTFIAGSAGVTVSRSQFHEGVSSCIRIQPGNQGVLVDAVHCHDYNWDESDDYCPRDGNNPHGSAVSMRSGDLTVRNSMFHDTPGLMLYDGDGYVASYSNVLIENNAIYDINNHVPLRIYGLADNIVVRNNVLVGKYREENGEITPDGRYRFNTAFNLHEPAPGYDATGLSLYNNILVGIATLQPGVDEHHNIIWSYSEAGDWRCDGGDGTTVATCTYGSAPTLFEDGFFAGDVDFWPDHRQALELRPAPGSPAINAGDVAAQPDRSLGQLADGFLAPSGPTRDADHHSIGAYEP